MMNPTLIDEFKEYASKGINDRGNLDEKGLTEYLRDAKENAK